MTPGAGACGRAPLDIVKNLLRSRLEESGCVTRKTRLARDDLFRFGGDDRGFSRSVVRRAFGRWGMVARTRRLLVSRGGDRVEAGRKSGFDLRETPAA